MQQIPTNFFTSYQVWNNYVSKLWRDLLSSLHISNLDIIVEIAPGTSDKIPIALAELNFQGKLILIEPLVVIKEKILLRYQTLLPNAEILVISKRLSDSLDLFPKNSIILSNSPIDDFLLAEIAPNDQSHLKQLFHWTQKDELLVESYFAKTWLTLQQSLTELQKVSQNVLQQWQNLIIDKQVKHCVISQYPSLVLRDNGLESLNLFALALLQELKHLFLSRVFDNSAVTAILRQHAHYEIPIIRDEVLNGYSWFVS
jgi:hypothetical protein